MTRNPQITLHVSHPLEAHFNKNVSTDCHDEIVNAA
jgi:hypothetical protein